MEMPVGLGIKLYRTEPCAAPLIAFNRLVLGNLGRIIILLFHVTRLEEGEQLLLFRNN